MQANFGKFKSFSERCRTAYRHGADEAALGCIGHDVISPQVIMVKHLLYFFGPVVDFVKFFYGKARLIEPTAQSGYLL
jgi:hypothetical protein